MSTKKTTTTNFDPNSMQRYQSAQNTLMGTYSQMVQNPYSGPAYQMGLQQNLRSANTLNAGNMRNAMQNYNMSGFGNLTGGARASLLSGLSRSASGMRQNAFFNNFNTATANQQFGASVLGQMQPLVTGQTQKTSGLGTWLPQVLGAGLGLASGFGGAAAGAMSGAASGSNSLSGLTGATGLYGPGFGAASPFGSNFGMPGANFAGQNNAFMSGGGFGAASPPSPSSGYLRF